MKSLSAQLILYCVLMCCFAACRQEEFNGEMPYAVLIAKNRTADLAESAMERLDDMGIAAYVKAYDHPEEGRWYLVLSGQFGSLESCMAERISLEDRFRFYFLDIANYNQLSEAFSDERPEQEELLDESRVGVFMAKQMPGLLGKLPATPNYQPQYVKLVANADSLPLRKFGNFRNEFFDLPRGIDPKKLLPRTTAFAEVGYKDELVGTQFVVHAFQLAEPNDPDFEKPFAEHYANEILTTRTYDFEEKLPINISAGESWKGFSINLEPKRGKIYRYMVLLNADGRTGAFIQSLKCTEGDMEIFAKSLSKGGGLTSYYRFRQNLQWYPANSGSSAGPYFISMKKLEEVKGRYARKLEANWKTEFEFHHPTKGDYALSFTSLPDFTDTAEAFSETFTGRSKKDSVVVNGKHAWLMTKTQRDPESGERIVTADELQFMGNGLIGIFKGQRNSLYRPEEAIQITESSFGIVKMQNTDNEGLTNAGI